MRHFFAALVLIATPAVAQTYGPPEPKPFVMPDRFTVQPNETVEQAQAKIEADRRCAKKWLLIGIVGGGALDIATTQINQSDGYREINPLYGKKATVGEMLLVKAVTGGINYWQISGAARRDPKKACSAAKWSAGAAFLPGVINIGVRVKF